VVIPVGYEDFITDLTNECQLITANPIIEDSSGTDLTTASINVGAKGTVYHAIVTDSQSHQITVTFNKPDNVDQYTNVKIGFSYTNPSSSSLAVEYSTNFNLQYQFYCQY